MARPTNTTSIELVIRKLPFGIDDIPKVNAQYKSWHESKTPQDKIYIDLWIYCYIRRYFITKQLQNAYFDANDIEELIGQAYHKIQILLPSITQPDRFASWVSVVCRNFFITYTRKRRQLFATEEALYDYQDRAVTAFDELLVYEVLDLAIQRLPEYLQETARLKFREDLTYEEMAARTGHSMQTLRAYIHKIIIRFKSDPEILGLIR